jgi:hypothetical protein
LPQEFCSTPPAGPAWPPLEPVIGDQTSYTYLLAALAQTLQSGGDFLIDIDDSVANAELIDEVYRRAGHFPRG